VKPPVDARLAFDSGRAEVVPDQTGVRLDFVATSSALVDRIRQFSSEPVSLVTHDDPAGVTAASLAPNIPVAGEAIDAPLVLIAGAISWTVPAESLQSLLVVDPATSRLDVDRRPLVALVNQLATEIDHPAANAAITVDDNGRLAVVPAVSAAEVDVEASVAAIAAGLLAGSDTIPLAIKETPPAISDTMAQTAVERGEQLIGTPIALTWDGGQGQLDRSDLLYALTIRSRPGADEPFVFGLDPDLVREGLERYAFEFDIPVQDARWRIIEGRIQLAVPESKGRELLLERGVADVMAAFLDENPEVTLGVRTIVPRWTTQDSAAITLGRDILGEGATWYGDSSEARRQNIEVAANLLTGWIVPPDATFSFADSVGLITEDKGFLTGLGIVDDGNGGFTTAPVVGGGICQVSTTLFQAAFWAGLPFVERHAHPYYLRNYGEAQTGLPGLDAMVNIEPDWTLDLRFKNTTGRWIAVIFVPDGTMLYARIVGTDPGWDVLVPEPVISNEVKSPTEMIFTDSPELPLGQERVVEVAQDGFDVTVFRSVQKNGKIVLEDSVYSRFSPSRNTTLRGTGTG
jgi:vancomycin resistance protein YoaR